MCACVCYQPSTCVPRGSTTVSRSASALLVSSPATATKDSNSTRTRRPAQVSEAHTHKYSFSFRLVIYAFSGFYPWFKIYLRMILFVYRLTEKKTFRIIQTAWNSCLTNEWACASDTAFILITSLELNWLKKVSKQNWAEFLLLSISRHIVVLFSCWR